MYAIRSYYAEERGFDLLGICRAYGAKPVGEDKSALHAADAAEKLQIFIGKIARNNFV